MFIRKLRIYLEPGAEAGGTPPAAAPASTPSPAPAAPAAEPTPALTPAAPPAAGSPPAPGTPAPSPAPEAGAPPPAAAAAPDTRLIATLPPPGTPEYFAAFDALSIEDKRKVEAEVQAITRGEAEPPKQPDPAAPASAAADEQAWKPGDEPFITDEELAGLPERQQETFRQMQQTLQEVAPLMSEEFQRGFKFFSEDPIIKERITQIQGGAIYDASGILMAYNPEVGGKLEDLTAIDPSLNPDEFAAAVKTRDEKIFEDGVRKGRNAGMLEAKKEVQIVETRAKIQQGFTSLVEKHPELKGDGNWAADAVHPANHFYKYLVEKGLSDAFLLDKGGFEAAYAGFLASDGTLSKNIEQHVQKSRFEFIRKIGDAQKSEAKVLSRNAPSGSVVNTHAQIPGVDVDRYMSDPVYARAKFDEVDLPTKRLLEQLRVGKLTPKTA